MTCIDLHMHLRVRHSCLQVPWQELSLHGVPLKHWTLPPSPHPTQLGGVATHALTGCCGCLVACDLSLPPQVAAIQGHLHTNDLASTT